MAKWRWFAAREHPKVVRELGLPAAEANPALTWCPLHNRPVGPVSHICDRCHEIAWKEVARRYAAQPHGTRKEKQ